MESSQVVASTYEIISGIGSGGGGEVFLAKHLRLDKLVVLKADKRKITAKPETLRREVDALKNLSHTYIPQVYDFFAENDVVYTVMDYIEGESLDKPLSRGIVFPQPQVVEWACELLEALAYLHSRPPYGILHSDIKPANIMLTPQGDIRLIDFNIALALKEEGAVYVGRSRGYASPEHYGIVFNPSPESEETEVDRKNTDNDPDKTEVTDRPVSSSSGSSSSNSSGKKILVDKRSDIYSLGATLYHLLSGRKPEINAIEVQRLSSPGVSEQIADIIAKAMNPNPQERFQSADEMLDAFRHLHERDKRVKKSKRRNKITGGCLAVCFALGMATIFGGISKMEAEAEEKRIEAVASEQQTKERAEREVAAEREQKEESQKLAETEREKKLIAQRESDALALITSSTERLASGDKQGAIREAGDALRLKTVYDAEARYALNNAKGTFDVFDGFKSLRTIEAPGEVLKHSISPDGNTIAVLTSGLCSVYDLNDGSLKLEINTDLSALSDAVFVDDDTLICAGSEGLCSYRISSGEKLWTGMKGTSIVVSKDGRKAATVYLDESMGYLLDTATGEILREIDFRGRKQQVGAVSTFADPEDNLFAINGDGSRIAVSFSDGSITLYDLNDESNNGDIFDDGSQYTHFEGGFYGDYFGLGCIGTSGSFAAIINLSDYGTEVSFPEETSAYHIKASAEGFYVSNGATLVFVDITDSQLNEAAFTSSEIVSFEVGDKGIFTALEDGRTCCFDFFANLTDEMRDMGKRSFVSQKGKRLALSRLDSKSVRILELEDHREAEFAEYDGSYDHSETRISTGRDSFMMFDFRGYRICSIDGETVAEGEFPDAVQIYDQQYRRINNDEYLEVIWYDGMHRYYSAKDGSLINEEQKEIPDTTLTDEFVTDKWRIISPLHGTPQVYSVANGELLGDFDFEAYLTYVTQVGQYVVVQYIDDEEIQNGLVLNSDMKRIAELPYCCDVLSDGTLFFDDMRGNVRQSKVEYAESEK